MAINSKLVFVEHHAALYKMVNESLEFDAHIQICDPYTSGVHVFSGICELADAVGASLMCEERENDQYDRKYYFYYKGVIFFQIEGESTDV